MEAVPLERWAACSWGRERGLVLVGVFCLTFAFALASLTSAAINSSFVLRVTPVMPFRWARSCNSLRLRVFHFSIDMRHHLWLRQYARDCEGIRQTIRGVVVPTSRWRERIVGD